MCEAATPSYCSYSKTTSNVQDDRRRRENWKASAILGSILFVSGFLLTACSNPGSDIQGTWNMSASGIPVGEATITPDSLSLYPNAFAAASGTKQVTEKAKWTRSGNQITAIEPAGTKVTFSILDPDHMNLGNGNESVLLSRNK